MTSRTPGPPPGGSRFAPTRWSMVLAAGAETGGDGRRCALEDLARSYWPPLYAYLRRDGHPPDRAEDLVQAFFARLIEKNDLRAVDRGKGKFRSFVLASLRHFVLNERAKERARKRGGGVRTVSFDAGDAETRYAAEPVDHRTPEDAFNRRWALTVLDAVFERLRREQADRGQGRAFEVLKGALTGDASDGYAAMAASLSTTEGAARVAAHRLRKRYRELLRAEIAQTVADPALVDEELRDLLACLSNP